MDDICILQNSDLDLNHNPDAGENPADFLAAPPEIKVCVNPCPSTKLVQRARGVYICTPWWQKHPVESQELSFSGRTEQAQQTFLQCRGQLLQEMLDYRKSQSAAQTHKATANIIRDRLSRKLTYLRRDLVINK